MGSDDGIDVDVSAFEVGGSVATGAFAFDGGDGPAGGTVFAEEVEEFFAEEFFSDDGDFFEFCFHRMELRKMAVFWRMGIPKARLKGKVIPSERVR